MTAAFEMTLEFRAPAGRSLPDIVCMFTCSIFCLLI